MARILGDLSIRVAVEGEETALAEGLEYRVGGAASARVVVAPPGFRMTLASMPWPVRWLAANLRGAARAAVIHDYLYSAEGRRLHGYTRAEADAIFAEALQVTGTRLWLVIYLAVRLLAAPHWRRCGREMAP